MNKQSELVIEDLELILASNSNLNHTQLDVDSILSEIGLSSVEMVSILLEMELKYPISMTEIDVSQHCIRSISELIIKRSAG